jgi:hypothetical protein
VRLGFIRTHGHAKQQILKQRNPLLIHEVPLHDVKVDAWCALSVRRNMGPVFPADTTNAEIYARQTLQVSK